MLDVLGLHIRVSQHKICAGTSGRSTVTIGGQRNLRQLTAATLFAALIACAAFAQSPSPTRVLLVYQTDGAPPAFVEFEQNLVLSLRAAMGSSLEFYREQLDATRFPELTQHKITELQSKFAARKIDVVICFGNMPSAILPGVPVVQISNFSSDRTGYSSHLANSVPVSFNVDARKIIDMARHLQPKARKVLLIGGADAEEHVDLMQFREQLSGEPNLDIHVVGDASIPELLAIVSRLPRDTIVLPLAYSRDPAGNSYLSLDIVAQLAAASAAPVYAVSDTYVGTGAVGGYVVSWAKTGEIAADAAVQILHGKTPAEVVLKSPGSDVYMFDWRQLQKWGFSESDLPLNSIVEYRVPTAWEQYRWRIVGSIAVIVAQFLLIVALLINRKKRRQAEGSLRETAGRLLQSQDEERRRIARDLHDGTAQHLSGMALTIGQVLADFPPGYDRLRTLLQDSHVASREALNEVRTVSYVLHPPILDGLGLVPALRWYLDGLQKRSGLIVEFKSPVEITDVTSDGERALFRIVQESINNVLRHSGGTAITVSLSQSGKEVTLEIGDDGHGMSAEELKQVEGAASLGVGITGMRERVRQLDGTFRISSNPSGTQVFVSLPRKEQHAANSARR
jgi:signal transduction histidine kinase